MYPVPVTGLVIQLQVTVIFPKLLQICNNVNLSCVKQFYSGFSSRFQKHSQRSRSILQDGSRSLRLFWKGKTLSSDQRKTVYYMQIIRGIAHQKRVLNGNLKSIFNNVFFINVNLSCVKQFYSGFSSRFQKHSQRSRSILQDGSRSLRLFWKGKTLSSDQRKTVYYMQIIRGIAHQKRVLNGNLKSIFNNVFFINKLIF